MENVFPPTIDVKEEKQRAGREKEWQKPKSSCACKQERGKESFDEFSGRDFPLH
jgi:hypothetical protein